MGGGIHFISGLPRSGSTLLAALLRQNPRCIAGMSSPVLPLYVSTQLALSSKNEFHVFISDHQRESVLRGIFRNFYDGVFDKKLVFDTSRLWCSKLSGLSTLFPNCKVICCVRSLAWILDSFERLWRVNALQPSRVFNFDQAGTVYSRVELLMGPGGVVRIAHEGLQEAFVGECSGRVLLIQYDSLTRSPESTMAAIYNFLGEEPFAHDFENVDFDAEAFDRLTGVPGLHRVGKLVRHVERSTILPTDIFRRFDRPYSFWLDETKNCNGVKII